MTGEDVTYCDVQSEAERQKPEKKPASESHIVCIYSTRLRLDDLKLFDLGEGICAVLNNIIYIIYLLNIIPN